MISPKSPKLYQSSVHQSATADATKVFACKPTALHAHPTIIVNAIPYKDTIRIAFPKRLEIRFSQMKDRRRARELAAEFIQKGDPTGWFEALYREAEEGKSTVPWVDYHPTPPLVGFWILHPQETTGKSALVVGSGFGDDAEQLAAWGFRVTAFDISETAIRASCLLLLPIGEGSSISFLKPIRFRSCPPPYARRPPKISPHFSPLAAFCLSLLAAANLPIPKARCPGLSPDPRFPPLLSTVSKSSCSILFPILTNLVFAVSAPSSVFPSAVL